MYMSLKWALAGAAAVLVMAGPSASAQDATTTAATTEASATTTAARTPRTTATPDMIKEAIERSHARTEKLRSQGRVEQWGSEEPFSYNPTRSMDDLATFQ